jgi:adhesin HecA-like repeat protein
VGRITDGRTWFGGAMAWGLNNTPQTFAPSGSHQTIFNGTTAQQITIKNGGPYAFQVLRIAAGVNVTMADNISVNGDMVIEAGSSFTIPAGKTLTVAGTLTNNGTIYKNGTGQIVGTVVNNGTIVP